MKLSSLNRARSFARDTMARVPSSVVRELVGEVDRLTALLEEAGGDAGHVDDVRAAEAASVRSAPRFASRHDVGADTETPPTPKRGGRRKKD